MANDLLITTKIGLKTALILAVKYSAPFRSLRQALLGTLLAMLWVGAVAAQTAGPTSPAITTPPPPTSTTPPPPAPKTGAPVAANQPEYKISAAETEKLFREVDDIMAFVVADTGLPQKQPVKKRVVSRQEVADYVENQLDKDEDAKRLERSEQVLQKFGLIPRDFHLHAAFVKLLKDQVAAYYDPRTKTVNMLDWVPLDQQESVLAHELTHALQDQNFDLIKYQREVPDEHGSSDLDLTQKDIDADERSSARQAVSEGQAMVVMMDYLLQPAGTSVAESPTMVDAMKRSMTESDSSIVMADAPLFLKDSLTFPYFYGLEFARVLMKSERPAGSRSAAPAKESAAAAATANTNAVQSSATQTTSAPVKLTPLDREQKKRAFTEPYKHPPTNSREIMDPATYLAKEKLPPMPLPRFSSVLKGSFERYDTGAIGEFDIHLLAKQYASGEVADRVSSGWRGGYYLAVHPTGAEPHKIALVFVSRWVDVAAASDFGAVYERGIGQRYTSPRPDPANVATPAPKVRRWFTEEGNVTMETDAEHRLLYVLEGFDDATAAKLRDVLHQAAARSN